MKYLFLTLLLTFSCIQMTVHAQSTSSIDMFDNKIAIEATIQNYFDGWLTGDTTLIGSAMHSTCHLKFIRDGKADVRSRTQYLSNFKPRPRLENAEGRIINIDITRNAASAKIELEIPNRLFTDYFNLLKIANRWYITDKVSTNIGKE